MILDGKMEGSAILTTQWNICTPALPTSEIYSKIDAKLVKPKSNSLCIQLFTILGLNDIEQQPNIPIWKLSLMKKRAEQKECEQTEKVLIIPYEEVARQFSSSHNIIEHIKITWWGG